VLIYRDPDQKNMLTRIQMHAQPRPSLSRDARHITHTHTGSLAAATLPAQLSACSMLRLRCHTILPNPAADLDLDLIQPVCLSVVPRTSLGPRRHRITQYSTALHSPRHTACHALPSIQPVRALYTLHCVLHSASGPPSSVFHIPIAVPSTESTVYSRYKHPPSPAHIPITRLGPSFRRTRWVM
jgi:hypothetical protein